MAADNTNRHDKSDNTLIELLKEEFSEIRSILKDSREGQQVLDNILRRRMKIDHRKRKQQAPLDAACIGTLISLLSGVLEEQPIEVSEDDILKHAIEDTVGRLCSELTSFKGDLIPIGSTHDGTRVSDTTDFDFLLELKSTPGCTDYANDITLYNIGTNHTRRVSATETIEPLKLYESFADEIIAVCDTLTFDPSSRLRFGGFAHPRFSGVRFNEPAVTIIFKWTDDQEKTKVISVDITLAIKIPRTAEQTLITNITKHVSNICPKVDLELVRDKCHLVPVWPYGGQWFLTTAVLEKWIFQQLGGCQIKSSIKECKRRAKFVSDDIQEAYEDIRSGDADDPLRYYQDFMETKLKEYRAYTEIEHDTRKLGELRTELGKLLSVGHIFFSPEQATDWAELGSKPVSFNSSGFKYKTLDLALRDKSENTPSSVEVNTVIDNLNNNIKHTFLLSDVRLVAIGYGGLVEREEIKTIVYQKAAHL